MNTELLSDGGMLIAAGIGVGALCRYINRVIEHRQPLLRWLRFQYGLADSAADDDALAAYVSRTRRWRVVGIVAGVILTAVGLAPPAASMMIGWFASGIIPEVTVRRRNRSPVRSARLARRSRPSFVTPSARRWLVLSAVTALTATVIAAAVPSSERADASMFFLVTASAVLAVVGTLAVAAIARRSVVATDEPDLLVDEAVRRMVTTRVISGWTALQFLVAWSAVPSPARVHQPYAWFAMVLASSCVLGILGAWAWMPTRIVRESGRNVAAS